MLLLNVSVERRVGEIGLSAAAAVKGSTLVVILGAATMLLLHGLTITGLAGASLVSVLVFVGVLALGVVLIV